LLDINPRLWTWSALGGRAGIDFPYLLWRMVMGEEVPRLKGQSGVRWVRMSTDIPSVLHSVLRGRLSVGSYLRSLRGPVEFALMAADDPIPGVMDLPVFVYKHLYNTYKALQGPLPQTVKKLSDAPVSLGQAPSGTQTLATSASTSATPLKQR